MTTVETVATIALWTFAAIGFLCVAASVIFGLGGYYATRPKPPAKPRPMPASEVVAGHTGNVRVVETRPGSQVGVCPNCGRFVHIDLAHACPTLGTTVTTLRTDRDAS